MLSVPLIFGASGLTARFAEALHRPDPFDDVVRIDKLKLNGHLTIARDLTAAALDALRPRFMGLSL
jgi:hypothetical protein